MPGTAPKLGRRTYVIDRGFQLKYTLMLVIVGAVISSLFGAMMYLAHTDALHALNPQPPLREELARADQTLIWLMAAITVLMAASFGLFGVLITHRVAGPVYVMSHYISVLANGRYPVMRKLRKNDELKVFFERFQDAIDSLRQREATEADRIHEALTVLEPLAHSSETKQVLDVLRAMHDRKRDATDRIETSAGRTLSA